MIIADNRTISLYPPWTQALLWPEAEPGDVLDYSLDISIALDETEDSISSVSVSAAPSGDGELSLESVTFSGGLITVTAGGGVAGRIYTVSIVVTTAASREFAFFPKLPISLNSVVTTPPPPPSPGYGAPISS